MWRPAEHRRAPDWLPLTRCRCDVTSDGDGGGGVGGFWGGGRRRGGEMRSLGAPSGDQRRPGARPTGRKGQVRAPKRGYKPRIQDMTWEVVVSWWTVEFIPLCLALTCLSHGNSRFTNTWSLYHLRPPRSAHVGVLVSMVAGGCVKVSLLALLRCYLQAGAKGSPQSSCRFMLHTRVYVRGRILGHVSTNVLFCLWQMFHVGSETVQRCEKLV